MANITRIKNNQITDATIEYTKIKAGTLVGSVFNPNLTLNSNVTIVGNLSITGTPTTIQSTNTYVNDPLVVFNNGYNGTPSYDVGIIANRNLGSLAPYGSVNTAFIWSESDGAWIAIATTETGATTGSINNSGWANVKVGNLISVSSTVNGALTATGVTTLGSTLNVTGATTLTTATAGGLQAVAIGNVTPGSGAFTSLTSGTTYTLNTGTAASLQVAAIGNVTPGSGAFTTLSASSTLNVTGATTLTTATTGGLQAVAIGNVTPGSGAFTTGTFNTVATGGLQAVAIGNVTPGTAAFTTLSATGASTLNTVTGASFQGVIGNVAPNTGAFTTLTASGITTLTSGTDSTTALTGALVVTGGAGISGNVYAGGKVSVGSSEATTGVNTGALQVPNGGAYIAGNLWVGGNINFTPNSVSTITGNSAQFFGNASGFGALYAGISSGYVYQPQTVMQNSTSFNGYAQLNHQNINNGGDATSDYVATADNGTESTYYIDMGIASSGYDNSTATNALGTSLFPNDGYLYAQGKAGFQGGNLTVGTSIPGTIVRMIAGGVDAANVIASATSTGFKVNVATASTSTTTGALQVAGGAGIVGDLYIGGTLNISGTTNLANATFTTATGGGLQVAAIGNVTPGTGNFTSLTAQTETVGGLQAVAIGNVTPGTGNFTTGTIANFASGNAQITGGDVTGLTNINATTGTIANFASGNVQITGGSLNGLSGGTGSTSAGTTQTLRVSSGGIAVGGDSYYTNSIGIGQNLSVTGWANVTNTTQSTSATTGAIITAGGAGIGKNLYVGGDTVITGNLTVNGDVTTVNTATLDVEDLNITVAKGAASAAAANGAGLTVDGASATLTYANADDSWNFNKLVNVNNTTQATNTTSGALIVDGGAGIAKNLYVGGLIQADTASFASINNTPIGNATPSTGAFTTLSATGATTLNTVTGASFQGKIGNVAPNTGDFTNITTGGLQAVAIGNVTPGTAVFTSITTAGSSGNISGVNYYIGSVVNAATIGNTGASLIGTLGTANQPNVTSLGTLTGLTVSGASALNTVTGASFQGKIGNVAPNTGAFTTVTTGGLQAVAIGNVTPGTAVFTTATIQQGLQNTPIGNVTPSVGGFTTLTASEWANVTATTASTSTTTGALKVAGGVGVAGNINAGVYGTSIHSLAGNVLIGRGPITPTAVDSILTINENTDIPLASAGLTVHLSGLSGKSASYGVDSFGTGFTSSFVGRHARGTSGSPSAVQTNDILGGVQFKGYGLTGFSSAATTSPGIQVIAKENFTDTAHGAGLSFLVTATGETEASGMMYLGTDGNLLIKSTTPSTSTSTGALTVVGGAGIAGNVNLGTNLHVNGAISGNSSIQVAGRISNLDTTDTTAPGTGGIQTPGGGSFGGNVYVGKNIYIGPASFDTSLSVPTIIAVDNGTNYAQMAILNTAGSGSSDYAAYTANGNDAGGWADMGIAGNTFSDPNYTITKSQDGYFFTRPTDSSAGGNLVIATSEAGSHNDIVIGVGSFLANAEVARFHGNASNNGTFVVKLPTNAVPAANTGAFQVWGGSSVSGNAYVGGALTVNGGKTANYDFYVKGKNDESLIWARPSASYDQVVIGGNATPAGLIGGAKLIVDSTDAIKLPTGSSGDRPSSQGYSDVEGMFRYNTTLGAIEWFTGAVWQTATTTFTIITDEQFNGDGSTTQFTLGGATTTAGTIVSINGVVQIPTLAYSITGAGNTTLEFTEAPASGDVIDVRRLTTTQTLFGIASPNGKNAIQTDNNGVYIYTGLTGGSSTATTSWDGYGNEVSNRANVTVSSANTATTIVTMNATAYRSGKFVVQATHGTDYQVMEALVVHDGTTASVMSYGIVQTNGNLGVLSATYSSGNVLLQFVASNTSTIVRTKSDFLTI